MTMTKWGPSSETCHLYPQYMTDIGLTGIIAELTTMNVQNENGCKYNRPRPTLNIILY